MRNAEVLSIHTKDGAVVLSNSKFPLHYSNLVIALGAEYAPESILGFSQFANHKYDLESALKLDRCQVWALYSIRIAVDLELTVFSKVCFDCLC